MGYSLLQILLTDPNNAFQRIKTQNSDLFFVIYIKKIQNAYAVHFCTLNIYNLLIYIKYDCRP